MINPVVRTLLPTVLRLDYYHCTILVPKRRITAPELDPSDHEIMVAPSFSKPLELPLSEETLCAINSHLTPLSPEEILTWALTHLPGLYQTTAFGLTGLVAIEMLSKLTSSPPPLTFLDTLYHFPETYQLVEEVKNKYGVDVSVYKPKGCEDVKAFEAKFGEKLWEYDESNYDFAVKVYKIFNVFKFTCTMMRNYYRSSRLKGHIES